MIDDRSRGALLGLTGRAEAGDVLRAIIEGLCYQYNDMLTALESGLKLRLDRCVTVGGVTRNQLWQQIKADVIGRPVEVPDVEEATPLGCAILAGLGVGLYDNVAAAFERVSRPGKTYYPRDENAAAYEKGFNLYQEIYPATKPIHHRIEG